MAMANTSYIPIDDSDIEYYYVFGIYMSLAIMMILVTAFGNILTIVAVFKEYSLRKVGNSFIVSLAATDLLIAVVVIPLFIIDELVNVVLGNILCTVHKASDIILSSVSILNITCISIDRYIAITDPLHYTTRMTSKVAGSLICCIWIVPVIIFALNEIIGSRFLYVHDKHCILNVFGIENMSFFIVIWFVPTLIMLLAYGVIFRVAQKQETQVCEIAQISNNLNNGQNISQPTSNQRSHKAVKTLGLITGIFMLCWLPTYAIVILENVSFNIALQTPRVVWQSIAFLSYLNSMLNPIIYAAYNQSFRKAFKKLFC